MQLFNGITISFLPYPQLLIVLILFLKWVILKLKINQYNIPKDVSMCSKFIDDLTDLMKIFMNKGLLSEEKIVILFICIYIR